MLTQRKQALMELFYMAKRYSGVTTSIKSAGNFFVKNIKDNLIPSLKVIFVSRSDIFNSELSKSCLIINPKYKNVGDKDYWEYRNKYIN